MKKIAVVGYRGKMGKPIFLALKENYELVGIGRGDSLQNCEGLDLVIDVASHETSLSSAEYCLKEDIPIIIGSTGQTEQEEARINEISKRILVIKKANFSGGIDAVRSIILRVLEMGPNRVVISETHHVNKLDSPSGTALALMGLIKSRFKGNVEIYSFREGDVRGEHQVKFYFDDEEIEIKHSILSRLAFVKGVVKEVENYFKKIDKKEKNL